MMLYLTIAQLRTLSEIVPGGVVIDGNALVYDDGVRAQPGDDDSYRSNVDAIHVSPDGDVTVIHNDGTSRDYSRDEVREMTRARILNPDA